MYDDAKASHLVLPVDVRSDDDARVMIANGHPVSQAQWWPYNWDDDGTFVQRIGQGEYGHAMLEVGYVMPGVWDEHDWWQLDNWHGLRYPTLPHEHGLLVPGYKPINDSTTSDFWVRGDVYRAVQAMGGWLRVTATDVKGIEKQIVTPSFLDAFPV